MFTAAHSVLSEFTVCRKQRWSHADFATGNSWPDSNSMVKGIKFFLGVCHFYTSYGLISPSVLEGCFYKIFSSVNPAFCFWFFSAAPIMPCLRKAYSYLRYNFLHWLDFLFQIRSALFPHLFDTLLSSHNTAHVSPSYLPPPLLRSRTGVSFHIENYMRRSGRMNTCQTMGGSWRISIGSAGSWKQMPESRVTFETYME